MSGSMKRDRFIPFRKADVVEMCIKDARLAETEIKEFREFCQILEALFLFKQISKYKNRKIKFMKALSDNLYFKNLDNNAGVFYHLIDAAEEEEFKEAVLAYYFLLTAEDPLTKKELDGRIENWLAEGWDCQIDFEIGDAVNKLQRLNLIQPDEEILKGVPLSEAKQQLDTIWDDFFIYNQKKVASDLK